MSDRTATILKMFVDILQKMRCSMSLRYTVVAVVTFVDIPQETHYSVSDRNVQITLAKEDNDWWPHLTRERTKLSWLRVSRCYS